MRSLPSAAFTVAGTVAAVAFAASASTAYADTLPQLDVTKFPPQIVWLVITFAVLYVIMATKGLPRVGQILEERQFRIDDNLKKAEHLKADAQAAAEAYELSLAQSRTTAQSILRDARETAASEAAKRQAELGERLAGEIHAAEARIGAAKDAALADVRTIAAEVAALVATKLTGEEVNATEAATAVAAAAEESR